MGILATFNDESEHPVTVTVSPGGTRGWALASVKTTLLYPTAASVVLDAVAVEDRTPAIVIADPTGRLEMAQLGPPP